jgi:Na+-driven multidrug efflux pump
MKAGGSVTLASLLQQEGKIGRKQKMYVVWQLSVPAILAQITFILMEYIDTAMVGNLGAGASAAIGVVSTTKVQILK